MNINCNGNLIDLSIPKVMGILNVTPNSFYDGGKHREINSIIHQVDKMLSEGADFIDVGAYSSKPSAAFVSETEEINRLIPKTEGIVDPLHFRVFLFQEILPLLSIAFEVLLFKGEIM